MRQSVRRNSVTSAGESGFSVGRSTTSSSSYTSTIIPSDGWNWLASSHRSTHSVENAVYGYIRTLRALGRTKVTASEIAVALSIPQHTVVKAFSTLRKKGVKFAE